MRIHLPTLFHTVPALDFSHCAFTSRCRNFGKAVIPYGHEVIEYSNEGSQALSTELVNILSAEEFAELKDLYAIEQPNSVANIDSTLYRRFTEKLISEMKGRVQPGDMIGHVFGIAYQQLAEIFPEAYHVELGIGYEQAWSSFRIYESYHWMSWHAGKEQRDGSDYHWVCPMMYDMDEWEPTYTEGDYLLYFGRIIERKGIAIVKEIARHTNLKVLMVGDGNKELLEPFLSDAPDNLEYRPPVTGKERSKLLGGARAMLMPTRFFEPFGNSGIEAQLCGTPLLASDFAAFSETMIHGYSGYRCHTLGDYLKAIELAPSLNRRAISSNAKAKYSIQNVGSQLDRIIRQVEMLGGKGWYSLEPTNAVWSNQ